MKKIGTVILNTTVLCLVLLTSSLGQSLPVGTPVLENYYRMNQLLGKVDSSISFTIRPLSSSIFDNNLDSGSTLRDEKSQFSDTIYQNNFSIIKILPLIWQQQLNLRNPYGWNDGAMIPARGYQTMVSGGFFGKLGPLSIQLQPQYVFAQNTDYETLDIYNGRPDLPVKFGQGTYSRVNWGQSSIRLTFGPVSAGLSNENLWWGPGMRNSLLMSNNAKGFKHFTLNTIKPIRTPAGSFEMQVVSGKLESSGYNKTLDSDPAYSDWRYLSAFVLNYQPKWVPGLFLGLTRAFQAYRGDVKKLGDYFPFFLPYQKIKRDVFEEPFGRDQLTSAYARWVFKKVNAEVYFEFGANDNAYNFRDFLGSPEHSRSYIFGLSKLVALKRREGEFIRINAETTQLSQTVDRVVRPAGSWYEHGQIVHGYTHKGEVLGAGVGPGGNLQSLDLAWVKGFKSFGLQFERYTRNEDYYYAAVNDLNGFSRKWVDLTAAAHSTWNYKNLIFNAKLQVINSVNYQWRLNNNDPRSYYIPENDVFNFHGELGLIYRF